MIPVLFLLRTVNVETLYGIYNDEAIHFLPATGSFFTGELLL
jgi:hypothetical protein